MQPAAPPHAGSRELELARPRLAILGSRGLPARYGGFETFVEELAPRLVERGIDVTVFCEDRSGPKPLVYRGVDLRYVRAFAPGPLRTLHFDLVCLQRAARAFDVVYLLGYGAECGAKLAQHAGARLWINPGGLEWRRSKWGREARFWLRSMEALACRLADRMIFDNAALAEEIVARHGARSTATIAYGAASLTQPLDPAPLRAFGVHPGAYDLVVCRFEPENHMLEIVRAHAAAAPGVPLVVVSNVDLDTDYVRAVRAAAGAEARFVGTVYDAAVLQPLRQNARLHIHGHSVGGTNPSLLEAMGAGSYVLAADNPFNREVLGANGAYWADEPELTQRLCSTAAMDAQQRRSQGRANLERVRRVYCWERIADQYSELIHIETRGAYASRRAA